MAENQMMYEIDFEYFHTGTGFKMNITTNGLFGLAACGINITNGIIKSGICDDSDFSELFGAESEDNSIYKALDFFTKIRTNNLNDAVSLYSQTTNLTVNLVYALTCIGNCMEEISGFLFKLPQYRAQGNEAFILCHLLKDAACKLEI